jgi:hypothetical protein
LTLASDFPHFFQSYLIHLMTLVMRLSNMTIVINTQ